LGAPTIMLGAPAIMLGAPSNTHLLGSGVNVQLIEKEVNGPHSP